MLSAQIVKQDSPADEALIRGLWIRMVEIFGHRWISAYGADAAVGAGRTWARGLTGISRAQISTGLDRVLLSAEGWPPSLPEFRSYCLNIPSQAQVTLELTRDSERSPFTRLVWSKLDSYAFRLADPVRAERMLREAYVLAQDHVLAGGDLPPPLLQLVATERPSVADPERVRQRIEEIRRTLDAMPHQICGER